MPYARSAIMSQLQALSSASAALGSSSADHDAAAHPANMAGLAQHQHQQSAEHHEEAEGARFQLMLNQLTELQQEVRQLKAVVEAQAVAQAQVSQQARCSVGSGGWAAHDTRASAH